MNVKSFRQIQDGDPEETSEWLESLQAVIEREGLERAHYLLEQMVDFTRRSGGYLPYDATTAYINTIPPNQGAKHPGDYETERRIRSFIRWNASRCSAIDLPRLSTMRSTNRNKSHAIEIITTARKIPPQFMSCDSKAMSLRSDSASNSCAMDNEVKAERPVTRNKVNRNRLRFISSTWPASFAAPMYALLV